MVEAFVLVMKNRHLSTWVRALGNAQKKQGWWTNRWSLSWKARGRDGAGNSAANSLLTNYVELEEQRKCFPFYYFSLFFEERRKDTLVGYGSGHVFFNYCASHIQIIGSSPEFSVSCKRKKSYRRGGGRKEWDMAETGLLFLDLAFFLLPSSFDSSVVFFLFSWPFGEKGGKTKKKKRNFIYTLSSHSFPISQEV